MTTGPTSDWDRVGQGFYRRTQLYTDVFDPDLDLENHIIAAAPYGGALAIHRDEGRIQQYRGSESVRSTIDIYSCSGRLIRRISWDKGVIKGLGWSEDERLLVISRDGVVRCYTELSEDFSPFTLGNHAEDHGVVACRFWSSGFAALLGNNEVISVTNYDEPRPRLLATPPSGQINSWAVISPSYTVSRSAEVLLSIGQTINVVDANDSEDRMLQNGPFRHIQVSPNGRFIALYTDDGKVWVITSDFQEKLSEYDMKSRTPPKDLQWCGNDAIVLAWEDEVHIVGPNGASAKYYYDDFVHLLPDVDGVRLITKDVCEFIQKVPDALEDTFRIGSTEPSAILLDALTHLEQMSPKADSNIELLRPNLVEAVNTCISAAGHEYNAHWQKQLLKSASFGKGSLSIYDSDDFVTMCTTLRILNAVRHYSIGLPLSYDQYFRLTPESLIVRLVNRQQYPLALRISAYLSLPSDRIYIHWASRKVHSTDADEDRICAQVVERLKGHRGISFDDIARAAYDVGRTSLATQLLDHEPRAARQVPLLLDMEADTLALDKAIQSGDTDLIHIVLLHLRRKLPLATFFRTINSRPVAVALVEESNRKQDPELLKDFYYQDDRRLDGAHLLFADALVQKDSQTKLDKLRSAARLLQDSKDLAPHTRLIEETAKLQRLQESLDADPAFSSPAAAGSNDGVSIERFQGLSLNDTVYRLIYREQLKKAQQVIGDFRIPERIAWWIRLRALVSSRNLREVEQIGTKNKKSPIGWEPFFEELLNAGCRTLAGNVFVAKCTNVTARERADMYIKCGMVSKAAEEAAKAKDREWLEVTRGKVEGKDKMELDRYINQLSKGR